MTEAFPLQWPVGWPRAKSRERARFGQKRSGGYGLQETTIATSLALLQNEVDRLGAQNYVLSSNVTLRLDGNPRSGENPIDPGVALYFSINGKESCIPCDKWDRVADNIKAIAKTIEALRGIERWGAKEMVDAAFRGFQALPDYHTTPAIGMFPNYFQDCSTKEQAKERYRKLLKELHPDRGGSTEEFQEMQRQYEQLR